LRLGAWGLRTTDGRRSGTGTGTGTGTDEPFRQAASLFVLAAALAAGCNWEDLPENDPSRSAPIRVQVIPDQAGPVKIAGEGDLRISTLPDLILRFEGSIPGNASWEAEKDGFRIAGQFYPSPIRISSPGHRPIGVRGGPDGPGAASPPRAYRGSLDLMNIAGKIRIINQLPLEDYLVAVVGGEMPASFPLSALAGQAIASRTYAIYHLLQNPRRSLDRAFEATPVFQNYPGVAGENAAARRAVRSTAGMVLTYQGKIFPAYFHSTCGGNTTNASLVYGTPEIPPLRGVHCEDCSHFSTYRWSLTLPLQQVEEIIARWAEENRVSMQELIALQGIEPLPGGYLRYVKVVHGGGSFEMRADAFKSLLSRSGIQGLKSTSFEVEAGKEPRTLEFRGAGFGHGIGLCQCGAGWKGKSETCEEILAAYYPESELRKVY
jgi:stage II sporulation protein D (peptidoglycan lytic transglycosylase)